MDEQQGGRDGDLAGKVNEDRRQSSCKNHVAMTGPGGGEKDEGEAHRRA